jgi:hypothetical protein
MGVGCQNNRFFDRTGNRYGRLVVVRLAGFGRRGSCWHCRCDCGQERVIRGELLGCQTNSCGCLHREMCIVRSTKHGMARRGWHRTAEYRAWAGARARCHNPKSPSFARYGGRGVRMCQKWRRSFPAFYRDIGPKPSPEYTLDRINSAGNYCPSNCRWLPANQQSANRRGVLWISCRGFTGTPKQWAKRTGIKADSIRRRIKEYGWPVEKALFTPRLKKPHKLRGFGFAVARRQLG